MRFYWHLLALTSLGLAIFIAKTRPDLMFIAVICIIFVGIFLFFVILGLVGKCLGSWWRERKIRHRDANSESPLERALARELDKQHIPYVREFVISHTHVDFAFPDSKVAVECDGWRYHHDRKAHDARRDAFLKSQGWSVLRFSGEEIRKDPHACVAKIAEHL
jgi:very-short-patch-repair endonuclease